MIHPKLLCEGKIALKFLADVNIEKTIVDELSLDLYPYKP